MLKESFDNTNQEAERVAARIEYIIKKGIYKPNEIAVLYRNNYQSNRIELELTNKGIPFITYGKLPFYEYIECKRIIAVYRFNKNLNDEILFKRIINIDENTYKIFYELYKKSNRPLLEFAVSYNNEVITNAAKALITLKKEKSNYTKARFFEAILELLFNNNFKQKQSERIRILKDLVVESELLDECEILNEIIINYDEKTKPHGVNLLTIHKSKGLEFKCVFIISLNDGIMPPLSLSPEQLEEERRICYVGITRAKEFLYLSESEWHNINGIKKKLKPSLFLVEIKNKSIAMQ